MSKAVFDISMSLPWGRGRPERAGPATGVRRHAQAPAENPQGSVYRFVTDGIESARMFEHLGDEHIQLEPADVLETSTAIHMRFRIAK